MCVCVCVVKYGTDTHLAFHIWVGGNLGSASGQPTDINWAYFWEQSVKVVCFQAHTPSTLLEMTPIYLILGTSEFFYRKGN